MAGIAGSIRRVNTEAPITAAKHVEKRLKGKRSPGARSRSPTYLPASQNGFDQVADIVSYTDCQRPYSQ
jgi:hypothetical protein